MRSYSGSHHQFKNPAGSGRVTVPHPKKDLPWPTVKWILQQSVEAIRHAKQEWVELQDAIIATLPLMPPQGPRTGVFFCLRPPCRLWKRVSGSTGR
jgi:hypothetical protein